MESPSKIVCHLSLKTRMHIYWNIERQIVTLIDFRAVCRGVLEGGTSGSVAPKEARGAPK